MSSQQNSGAAIDTRRLTKFYGATPALRGVDLQLETGQIVGLVGANGCGKTTLLKILAGVISEYSGDATILGLKPSVATKARVAFLSDANLVPARMKVTDALSLYEDFFADFDRRLADELITQLGLSPSQRGSEMSKGMREKLRLALIMGRRADIYLLDEPMGGIDPAAREAILRTIIGNDPDGSLVVVSTHQVSDVEQVLDRAVIMKQGVITHNITLDELREQYGIGLDGFLRQVY
ncbi:MAG: ABC transporter ATP-binding protein [Actinomycetaceae bacterium]|nr:ABC transporter ATP-binding protein [Actinomycetaceae bacterium]